MKHACRRVSQLTSDSFERQLSLTEKLQLKLHLAMCRLCRNYQQSLQTMESVLRHIRRQNTSTDAHLSEEAKQRIQQLLDEEKGIK